MATWPANGTINWNTPMLAYLAISLNTDGTLKVSAYTNEDSDANAMLKSHAYKAATPGYVTAYVELTTDGNVIFGYVGTTNDPAGAGDLIAAQEINATSATYASISFLVAKDEYFEILSDTGTPVIRWKSFGALSKPVDQD